MKVKVAQCWDDGVATDIRLIEILRKYNAKATFNLCPWFMGRETIPSFWLDPLSRNGSFNGFIAGRVGTRDLREVYDGFQVASHCWKHETAGEVPDDVFLKAATDARKFLEDSFQKECRGFAWPNGRHTPETEKLLAEAGFLYGRTTVYTPDLRNNDDPMALASNCHFLNPLFWKIFDEAKKTGFFYFWGHSYEMMDYSVLWGRFEVKIKALCDDPDVEWVDVAELPELIRKNRESQRQENLS